MRGKPGFSIAFAALAFACLCAVSFAAPPTHTISGYAKTAAGIGVQGVSVTGNNGAGSSVTGADGSYSITVPNHWSGTINATKSGWLLTPASRTYTSVSEDRPNQDYAAYQPKISGTVTKSDGTPLAGVTVTANNSGGTITTNAAGAYELAIPYNWSGSLSASLSGYNFTPKNYTNLTTDQPNQNFIAFQPTISGYVRKSDGTGLSGVTLTANNSGGTTTNNASGYYELAVPYNWSGTLSASLSGCGFSAKNYTNIITDQPNQNFIAFQPTISGTTGIAGATVTPSGLGNVTSTPNYSFTVPYGWSGTVTVTLAGYGFTESPRSYSNLIINLSGQNFTPYQPKISGYVSNAAGTGLSGATVTADNGGGSTVTRADGYYEVIVPYGWTGTLSADLAGYGFTARNYTGVTTDRPSQNFSGFQPTISGYTGIAGATVTATGVGSVTSNPSYAITVPFGWSGTVTVTLAGYGFTDSPRSYSNLIINRGGQNFTPYQPKISGYVKKADASGYADVTVSADNGGGVTTTSANGYYEIRVPYGWAGTVTAEKYNLSFAPESYTYSTVTTDQSNQDFAIAYAGVITVKANGTGYVPTIQDAVEIAVDGDIVQVEDGTYTGNGNRDIDFLGKAITVRGNVADPNLVVIDCQGNDSNRCRGFTFFRGEANTSVLEGLTVKNGYRPSSSYAPVYYSDYGGGISISNSSPSIKKCIIIDCEAKYGAGIGCNGTNNPAIEHCTITGNYASYSGGAFYGCNGTITNCTVSDNLAFMGGGLGYCDGIITNCKVSGNTADNGAGFYDCSGTISHCTISDNSTFSTIYNYGGGLYDCDGIIMNCIVSGNTAEEGGGFYACSGTILNCTVSGNVASLTGGGFYNCGTIRNSILWGNIAASHSQIDGNAYLTYSCVQDLNRGGIGNIGDDPMLIDAANGNFRLSIESPCINAGHDAGPNETDIYGGPRVVGTKVDIGAYEYSTSIASIYVPENKFTFTAFQAGSNPISQRSTVYNLGLTGLNWMASSSDNWLVVRPDSGSLNYNEIAILTIAPDTSNLIAGEYFGQITISDPNAINSPQVIDVNLVIIGPELGVSQSTYSFTASKETLNPAPQVLTISNPAGGTLNWTITPDCDWMDIQPASGTLTTGSVDVLLDINQDKIEYGLHTCVLTVSAPGATGSSKTVTVDLTVLPPQMQISPVSFTFNAQGISDVPAPQVLTIQNIGYDTVNWSIAKNDVCDWLLVSPQNGHAASGMSSDVQFSVDPAMAGYGSHNCQLTIADPNATGSPQTITVSLNVARPQIVLSPASLTFGCDIDEPNTLTQTLTISSSGPDVLNWQITENCDWLSVEPASASYTTEPNHVTVRVNTTGLEIGNYSANLIITAAEASNSPRTVPVNLHVYRAGERHVPTEYPSIAQAVTAAVTGDHVVIHPGIYSGYSNTRIAISGKALTIRSTEPDNKAVVERTIISGIDSQIYGIGIDGAAASSSVINGLVFQYFSTTTIYIMQSSSTIENCIFRDSNPSSYGCVYLSNSSARIENCLFVNIYSGSTRNAAFGIVIDNHMLRDANVDIRNCLICICRAYSTESIASGIRIFGGFANVTNCTIAYNHGQNPGTHIATSPAMFVHSADVSVRNSIIWGNQADDDSQIDVVINATMPESRPARLSIAHSTIQGGMGSILLFPDSASYEKYRLTQMIPDPNLIDPNALIWGPGNIDVDPLFARVPNDGGDGWIDIAGNAIDESANNDYGDLHLKSEAGRFAWTGLPKTDFNVDGTVNLTDFLLVSKWWRRTLHNYPQMFYLDVDRNLTVNEAELLAIADNWLHIGAYGQWVQDDMTSPCIDAGDPDDLGWQSELWPHGGRINMGAYGGTPEASMSLNPVGNIADLNHDDAVNLLDWSLWSDDWLKVRPLLDSDLDRDSDVDPNDLVIFTDNWLLGPEL